MSKLNTEETQELIDILRMTLLYQTPMSATHQQQDKTIDCVAVKMYIELYGRMMHLIDKAGGWDMPAASKMEYIKWHEAEAKKAMLSGEGTGEYDCTKLSPAQISMLYAGLEADSELFPGFREALKKEVENRMNISEEEKAQLING